MKAIQEEFYEKNRQFLHKVVPLDMPLSVFIEISTACDLRCSFCSMSSENALKQLGHFTKNMNDETFALVVEQLKEFPRPFRRLTFGGLGECLMHPKLPDMIRTIKKSGIASVIALFTNAVNLKNETSLALIDAGLDVITISVNGLNAGDYERFCGRRIDYDKFVEQIAFLYAHKGDLRMQLKTADLYINNDDDKAFFFNTFGNICDFIDIEIIASYMPGVDYILENNIKVENKYSKFASINVTRNICSFPFIRLYISVLGKINFCDALVGFPYIDLNIHEKRLIDMWNGPVHKQLLLNQLQSINEGISAICKYCTLKHCCAFEEDNLDPYAEEIYERILKKDLE